MVLSSGCGIGHATQWSQIQLGLPTAAGMGYRLWVDKTLQYFTNPARPTQSSYPL